MFALITNQPSSRAISDPMQPTNPNPTTVGLTGLAGLMSGVIAFFTRIENRVAEIQKGLAAVGEIGRKSLIRR
jgi:hypothetical protein